MASSDFITPANRKVRIGDVEANRPNSSSVNETIGGSLNFVLDRLFYDFKFNFPGFYSSNNFDEGYSGIELIENDCTIDRYYMAIRKTGSSGTNSFNVAVYDVLGAFVGNLFGNGSSALSVSGSNGTNVVVGKKNINSGSPVNILVNTAGHTVFNGSLTLGTTTTPLLAGYVLIPYVISNGIASYNLNFSTRIKEL